MQSDGSQLRQITFGPDAGTGPSIAADGRKGVYLQGGQINVLQPFAPLQPPGLRIAITQFRYSVPQSPVISNDGSRVVFLLGPSQASGGAVYEVDYDGSGVRRLYAPLALSPGGVVSAADSSASPSPGSLFSIYGINFTEDRLAAAAAFPLPQTLAGLSALLNSQKVPLAAVTPWQINAQVPPELSPQTLNVQISSSSTATTPPLAVAIKATAPAIFSTTVMSGQLTFVQAAALHAGTGVLADDAHPASAGEVLEIFGVGLGSTDPIIAAGAPAPSTPPARTLDTPEVRIGNAPATVLFSGLAPGFAGVYQVNVIVPTGLRPGRQTIALRIGDQANNAVATVAVK